MREREGPDRPESLARLLGGRTGAVDATLPPVAFVGGWLAAGQSVVAGVVAALGTAVVLGGWRLYRGAWPRAALVGLLMVALAAVVVLRTGRAADFFLVQLATNAASAPTAAGAGCGCCSTWSGSRYLPPCGWPVRWWH